MLKIFTDLAMTTLVMKKVISVPMTIPIIRKAFESDLKLWKKKPNTVIPTKTTRYVMISSTGRKIMESPTFSSLASL